MTFVQMKFILLLFLVSHASLLQILLEHIRADLDKGATALQEETNGTSDSLDLLLLDGSMCNEYSTGGSLVSSGIQQVSSILAYEKSGKNQLANVAIVSIKCIAECLIIQSVLEKFNKSTLLLSLNPKQLHDYQEVTSFIPPAKELGEAFLTLVKSLDWSRFGILTNSRHFYHRRLADYFEYMAKEQNLTIFPVVDTHNGLRQKIRVESLLQKIEISGAKVLVVLTEEAPQILCAAYARGMVWPYYGWIIYGYTSPNLTNFPACTGSFSYLEGTVFPTYYTYPTTKDSQEDTAVGLLYKASAQAALLNTDLKTALLRLPVPGIQPNLTFHSIKNNTPAVYFLQVRNGTATRVATVLNGTVTENQWLQEEQLPRGRLPVRVNTVYPTWLAATEVSVCGLLITVTLILYIWYRKEPEVKATSWSLSLLILLGCYFFVAYLALLMIRVLVKPGFVNVCVIQVWFSGVGVSYPLILAVVLVKLVRIYRIFYCHSQMGKLCSNGALFMYVLLFLFPSVVILIVMTSTYPYEWSIETITHTNYVEVLYVCKGDLGIYFAVFTAYIILLILAIAVVAIKTRKLRYKHFQDTKKVNLFLFFIVLIGISGLILYKVTFDLGSLLVSYIVLHVVHCTYIGLCLGFLFLPKLFPIIKRMFCEKLNSY